MSEILRLIDEPATGIRRHHSGLRLAAARRPLPGSGSHSRIPEARYLRHLTLPRVNSRNSESRLLIIEMVLPAGDTPHPGKMVDMMMLVGPGGQERTEQEYTTLLGKAGLQFTRVVPTESAVSVIEAGLA